MQDSRKTANEDKIKRTLDEKLKKFLEILHGGIVLSLLIPRYNPKYPDAVPHGSHKKHSNYLESAKYQPPFGAIFDSL